MLLGLFFDLAHIFPNLVSKKISQANPGSRMIFYTFSLKKKNHDFINTRRRGDNNFSPAGGEERPECRFVSLGATR
ncbi:hypothetical protein DDT56_10725 [Brenneria corticis]|uniref:Uncharacterized protein n=1 Tax=Brenneria corticis TaxID=2173106 RepID=A0A2U1U2W1_9GAMM|nr:hypothetical protein DDT56_10725 [Brenneria sp. CFCC 11842]